ncbi:MAG: hypothetical protein IT379_42995 [Deltaproteobacteria bacterium]|nr:hypothetical protein [Deltaproteobacteria bacterium]
MIAALACGWLEAHARAEPAPGAEPVPSAEGPPVAEEVPADQRAEGRGIQYGGHIVVAIPAHGVFAQDFGVGIGIHGRIGWELPSGLSLEANLGYLFISVLDNDVGGVDGDDGMGALYLGGGGRFAFLNPSALVPFLGAGLGINLWIVPTETEFRGRSGQYYCGSDFACELVPGGSDETGFGGLSLLGNVSAGAIYEVTANIAIELGAQYNVVIVPGPFHAASGANFGYVTLFGGATLYF